VTSLTVGVECYAGHRGEQTPRTLILDDRRIAVAKVVDAWLAPDHRYFKLKGADGNTYLVRHDERSDTWELTMFRADPVRTAEPGDVPEFEVQSSKFEV